ncbi:MAG: CBS domain-containing protein [Methanobacterium sp. ERen5]|nr:MAG: CBS domain-containing protein [Methanobacterium sp. ERen5]
MEMDTKVTVHDAMTSSVITADSKTTVADAAILMSRFKIGCLVIKGETGPLGIITESDIIAKVVAKNLMANEINIGQIMTKDLIFIDPGSELNQAARTMAKNRIRRLPVTDNGILVGILTSTDVLMVSPELTELLVENARMENQKDYKDSDGSVPGTCEVCGNYVDYLDVFDGKFVCEECKEDLDGD